MKEILVDENGYNQFLEELEKLKQQSLLISSVGSKAYQDAIGDGWHDNFAFEESMRQGRNVATRIENMLKTKQYLKIIETKIKNDKLINIGDVLKVKIYYSNEDVEETTIKLTGNFIPIIEDENDIQEITLNSPLGKALYLKNIEEDDIAYDVNNKKIKITIIEKINNSGVILMITDINLNLYRVFYICSKCNSFVEASKKLCVSQPAISKQIKNLEDLLGTKLFYRDSNGLVLTNDGKQLYNYIDKSYNYLMAGEKIIKENNNMNVGTIVIGAPAHIASFYLLEYIEEYRKKHPNVFFRIVNGTTTELLKGLEDHRIDFVIDSSPINIVNKDMKVVTLASFDTCFVTSNNNKETDIKNHKYIMPYERSSIRKNLEKELAKHDVKLNVVLEVETTDLIISSVKREIGTGYVVKQAVSQELKTNELIELKTSYDLPKLELNLVYIEDYLTNLSNYFIKNHIT